MVHALTGSAPPALYTVDSDSSPLFTGSGTFPRRDPEAHRLLSRGSGESDFPEPSQDIQEKKNAAAGVFLVQSEASKDAWQDHS